jgi:hypothetical protein
MSDQAKLDAIYSDPANQPSAEYMRRLKALQFKALRKQGGSVENAQELPKFFIHSACCMAHWELMSYEDGTADLLCEKCGKPAGSMVRISVDSRLIAKCFCCGKSVEKTPVGAVLTPEGVPLAVGQKWESTDPRDLHGRPPVTIVAIDKSKGRVVAKTAAGRTVRIKVSRMRRNNKG